MNISQIQSDFLSQEVKLLEPILWWILNDSWFDLNKLGFSIDEIQSLQCKSLFTSLKKVEEEGYGRDIVQIVNYFKDDGHNPSYITWLITSSYTVVGLEPYIKKYKEFITKKKVLSIGNNLMLKATSDLKSTDLIEYSNHLLNLIESSSSSYDVGKNVDELFNYLEERKWKDLFGYSFWGEFQFLDKATRWIQAGRTYRVGALSNMGKTQWVYGIINNLIAQWAKVAFFSLENDRDMTTSNLVANAQRINSWDLESGKVSIDIATLEKMNEKLFIIDDTYELSDIFSKILAIKPDVVILDYIGLVNIKKFSEDEKYTEYSKRVQEFVKQTRVGWIDLSNLPIGIEDSMILSRWQFYWSSFLRNNADVGLHLIKYEDYYKTRAMVESQPTHKDRCEKDLEYRMQWVGKKAIKLAITKNRIGPAGLDEDYFVNFSQWGRFNQITPEQKLKFTPV